MSNIVNFVYSKSVIPVERSFKVLVYAERVIKVSRQIRVAFGAGNVQGTIDNDTPPLTGQIYPRLKRL